MAASKAEGFISQYHHTVGADGFVNQHQQILVCKYLPAVHRGTNDSIFNISMTEEQNIFSFSFSGLNQLIKGNALTRGCVDDYLDKALQHERTPELGCLQSISGVSVLRRPFTRPLSPSSGQRMFPATPSTKTLCDKRWSR